MQTQVSFRPTGREQGNSSSHIPDKETYEKNKGKGRQPCTGRLKGTCAVSWKREGEVRNLNGKGEVAEILRCKNVLR